MNCLAITYYDAPLIRKSIDCLMKTARLTVIENESPHTPEIQSYLQDLVTTGKIEEYYHFHENISNNAFEITLERHFDKAGPYLLFTDGDVTVQGDYVSEEIKILENCPEVAFVSVRLDQSNLPVKAMPESVHWIPPVLSEHDLYIEQYSGHQLVMMRAAEFETYNAFRKSKGFSWTDGSMRQWAYANGRKWAVTRDSTAYHLTWDTYSDLEHPYTKLKQNLNASETWDHQRTSPYTRYTREDTTHYENGRKAP